MKVQGFRPVSVDYSTYTSTPVKLPF